ncbi:hypothetical protein ACHAWF_009739 [Thalassiosira exigua]
MNSRTVLVDLCAIPGHALKRYRIHPYVKCVALLVLRFSYSRILLLHTFHSDLYAFFPLPLSLSGDRSICSFLYLKTAQPTIKPTNSPSLSPSKKPTAKPSEAPTNVPTTAPSRAPTNRPATAAPTSSPNESGTTYCGCDDCTQAVWDAIATDSSGSFTCGGRIEWLQTQGYNELDACNRVSSEFPNGLCGPACACNSSPPPQTSGRKCGGAVDFTSNPEQACETYLWGPTGDSTMACFAYGGPADKCSLNNNNDQDDGIFKDPSLCLGDTFYLWDEPDTQGRDYNWAGAAWLEYSERFSQELGQMRSRGTKVTGPLLKAGSNGVIEQNMRTFFDACGAACFDPSDPAYIDIIAINGFCGPWNDAYGGCRGGAAFIYNEVVSASGAFNGLPVYITNWSRLQTSNPFGKKFLSIHNMISQNHFNSLSSFSLPLPPSPNFLDQVEAVEAIDEFFPVPSSIVHRVYWFGARDYGGGAQTGYLTNILPDGSTLGERWRSKCDSVEGSFV